MTTRATIRSLARILADQTNSTFPTDTECNTLIDMVAHRVWRQLIHAGWRPFKDGASITASGLYKYPIATNVSYIEQVVRVEGTTRTPLLALKPEDRAEYESMGTGPATHYLLFSGVTTADGVDEMQIQLFPRPTSGTYEVDFTEQFGGFSADASKWFGPESSDELIALGSAAEMLLKEGDDQMAKFRTDQYNALYAEICAEAGWLDATNPNTVRDSRKANQFATKSAFDYMASEGWY